LWRWFEDAKSAAARLKRVPIRRQLYRYQVVAEALPAKLETGRVYLVEDDSYLEQAAMICPCGCGATLHLNLLADERPVWTVTTHQDGTVSLMPSVWRRVGCKSHFWLRSGDVEWCE
jgi:hypothetical protein